MLEEIRIRSLGVIRDAVLDFGPGLTVLTGETGAGKTMVVTGLGLLLGARADATSVRAGDASAVVEGRVLVHAAGPVAARAKEAGAELDDCRQGDQQLLLVSRSVSAQGGSRAHLGGRGVPVGVLGEIADQLVAVHGQSGQLRLRSPAAQLGALDRFAGAAVQEPLADYRSAYQRLREVEATLQDVLTRTRERVREADLLRLGLEEVERVAPQSGEDAQLRQESERLTHAEELAGAASLAHAALMGDPIGTESGAEAGADAAALVGAARRAVDHVRQHDPTLAALAERLEELGYLISDVGSELAGYSAEVESDPTRLAAAQERRAVLTSLTRKYGDDVDAVLIWSQQASTRLLELEGDDDRVLALKVERDELDAHLSSYASTLSVARREAAARLGAQVSAELAELAMPNAELVVRVDERATPGPHGIDDVELLLSAHAGSPPRPVAKGASGGELSRVMLALEVVLAGVDPVPTFVFDEVDAGVGGRAAVEVGRRLARLAGTAQVLVVTHLPQVAAFADRHLVVVKADDGTVTESGVQVLSEDGRVRELARMLAGQEESGSARAHAQELLTDARSAR